MGNATLIFTLKTFIYTNPDFLQNGHLSFSKSSTKDFYT